MVNHPLRRRIIRDLILFGNVGITSVMATVIITFLDVEGGQQLLSTLGTLVLGLLAFVLLGKIGLITKVLDWSIRKGLESVGMLHVADYDLLLRVRSGFCVSEIEVLPESPLANTVLGESRPADRGVIVLGITKGDGRFIGVPNRHQCVEPGDVLLVYGNEAAIVPLRHPVKPSESTS